MVQLFHLLSILSVLLVDDIGCELMRSCADKSPYCNSNECSVRPGYAMVYCRKTCGNCQDFCEDSKHITCSNDRKKDCDEMLADYCPKLCGKCTSLKPKRTKTVPVSQTPEIPKKSEKSVKEIRKSQSKRMLMPNGTFVTPPISQIEKLDDPHMMSFEFPAIYPSSMRQSWPEPEPAPVRPFSGSSWPNYPYGHQQYYPYHHFSTQYQQYQMPNYNFVYPWTQPYIPTVPNYNSLQRIPQLSYSTPPDTNFLSQKHNSIIMDASDEAPKLFGPLQMSNNNDNSPQNLANIIQLLGCKDKDESICSQITAETCLSRPGYYLKLCPVTCKNCSGLQCIDSIKMDCGEVRAQGACKLAVAAEYCPRTCELCSPPKGLAANLSECKDELDTCEQLAASGACTQEFSKSTLRLYCAKSCGFCKIPQFYFSDSPLLSTIRSR